HAGNAPPSRCPPEGEPVDLADQVRRRILWAGAGEADQQVGAAGGLVAVHVGNQVGDDVLDAVVTRMAAPGLFDQGVVASGRGRGGDGGVGGEELAQPV